LHGHDRDLSQAPTTLDAIDLKSFLNLLRQPRRGIQGGLAQLDLIESEQSAKNGARRTTRLLSDQPFTFGPISFDVVTTRTALDQRNQ